MAWEENSRICLHMQLIAILSRTGVEGGHGYAWKCCSDNTIPKDTTTVQKPVLNPGTKMY